MARKKGFASMSKEKRQLVASLGGKTAWAKGRAHKWSSKEASIAGRLGGRPKKKEHCFTTPASNTAAS